MHCHALTLCNDRCACTALHCTPTAYIAQLCFSRIDLTTETYDLLCEKVSELDAAVIAAAVLSKGHVLASRVKPGIFIPEGKGLERILVQLNILVGIPKTNENLFGKVGYVVVNHGSGDHMLFPLANDHIVIVSVMAPYTPQLMQKVQQAIHEMVPRSSPRQS